MRTWPKKGHGDGRGKRYRPGDRTGFAAEGARAILDVNRPALKGRWRITRPSAGLFARTSATGIGFAGFRRDGRAFGRNRRSRGQRGHQRPSDFVDITPQQWDKVLGINLKGIFLCAKEAARRMMAQKSGVILMTASSNGTEGHRWYADYNASKAGVILLAKTMALELAPTVRVNAVCPGYVLTPMQKAEYTPEMLAQVNEGIPLNARRARGDRGLYPSGIGRRGYITGADIRIDGGETRDFIPEAEFSLKEGIGHELDCKGFGLQGMVAVSRGRPGGIVWCGPFLLKWVLGGTVDVTNKGAGRRGELGKAPLVKVTSVGGKCRAGTRGEGSLRGVRRLVNCAGVIRRKSWWTWRKRMGPVSTWLKGISRFQVRRPVMANRAAEAS